MYCQNEFRNHESEFCRRPKVTMFIFSPFATSSHDTQFRHVCVLTPLYLYLYMKKKHFVYMEKASVKSVKVVIIMLHIEKNSHVGAAELHTFLLSSMISSHCTQIDYSKVEASVSPF